MKLSTFIALLKTYPKNADVSLLGLDDFYIYYVVEASKKKNYILLDTESLDVDHVKILDTRLIAPSFEKAVADADDLDDQVKIAKSLLKLLDGKDDK